MSIAPRARRLALVCVLAIPTALTACGGESEETGKDAGSGAVDKPVQQPAGRPGKAAPTAAAAAGWSRPAPETVILRVNGREITQGDIDSHMEAQYPMLRDGGPRADQFRKQLLPQMTDQLTTMAILEEQAAKEGFKPTPAEVEEEWTKIVARIQSHSPGTEIKAFLQKQRTSEAEIRKQILHKLAVDALMKKHATPAHEITDQEVRAAYDGNPQRFTAETRMRARHILLRTDAKGVTPEQKAEKKQELEAIREKLVAEDGKGFEEAAKQHSDCPTGAKGGDLGYQTQRQLVPPFWNAAVAAEVGEITDIVETSYGYHIIKLEDLQPGGVKKFEEVADSLRQELEQKARGEAQRSYIKALRAASTIETVTPAK